jgi:hypothetical protein
MFPKIIKARQIIGRNIVLRDANVDDAAFILFLRTDPKKNRFISGTSGSLDDQINWLRKYETSQDQAYFIIEDKNNNKLGCVRMYNSMEFSYTWGSWILVDGLSPLISIQSALLVYFYGGFLGFKEARLDVRKGNKFVWRFHESFSAAERVKETDVDYFYVVREDSIIKSLQRNYKLIGSPTVVAF